MYGTRRHPQKLRCVSDRNPISARKGATSRGMAIIAATIVEGTCSSTIITRFNVP